MPLVGGVAVYRARALYDLFDDSQDFDDPALCLQHGIITRHMELPNGQALIGILPNPASDEATLVYSLNEGTTGHLMLYDALGQEVQRYPLSTDAQRFYFSTTELAPGAYHYVVRENHAILGEGKLVVVH